MVISHTRCRTSVSACDPVFGRVECVPDGCAGFVRAAVGGKWVDTAAHETIIDPLNGSPFLRVPLTSEEEARQFVAGLKSCPKTGLHNPLKNVERCAALASLLACSQTR